jgi:hypothetical protein
MLFAVLAVGPARSAALSIGGEVKASIAGSYSSSALQTLAGAAGQQQTIGADTYTGISLWTLLGGADGIVPNGTGTGNNPLLRDFVTVTAGNGSRSLISVGEIDPRFGGFGSDPVLVAYKKGNDLLDTPVLIEREDPAGSRNVFDLASVQIGSVPQLAPLSRSLSSVLTVGGAVGTPGSSFMLDDLQALPVTTLNGIAFNGGPQFSYTGVRLWDFLNHVGIDADAALRGYVVVRATDNVQAVFSLAEIDPARRGPQDVLLAYDRDPAATGGGLGQDGFLRLIVPGDDRGGRYLSNVTALDVAYIQAVPEARTWTLMMAGMVLVWIAARRRSTIS